MLSFMQDTFVTMFDGSPEKALRAVLVVMGIYVLTAFPLVSWVLYSLFQKDPKVSFLELPLNYCSQRLQ